VTAAKAAAALPTARTIQTLDNEQLLKLLGVVCRDVTRRFRNYGEQSSPSALLDGLKFAKRVDAVTGELRHGSGMYVGQSWEWSLFHVQETLTRRLAESSFDRLDDEALDGVDLDG
jgi:hypothetical protein